MLQTFGLTHINIPVKDLEVSARFYRDLFGLKEIRRFEKCVMLRTPNTQEVITISENAQRADFLSKAEGFHFGFRLREPMEMSRVLENMTELGGKSLEHGGSREHGRLYAFGNDPNGYCVEVFWEND